MGDLILAAIAFVSLIFYGHAGVATARWYFRNGDYVWRLGSEADWATLWLPLMLWPIFVPWILISLSFPRESLNRYITAPSKKDQEREAARERIRQLAEMEQMEEERRRLDDERLASKIRAAELETLKVPWYQTPYWKAREAAWYPKKENKS